MMQHYWLQAILFIVCLSLVGVGYSNGNENGHENGNGHQGGNVNSIPEVNVGFDIELSVPITLEGSTSTPLLGDASAISEANPTSDATSNSDSNSNANSEAVGGTASAIVTFAERPDKITIKNTPSMRAPDILPTVSCFKPQINGALSLPGFGFSGGRGTIDEDCVKREYIRLAMAMGLLNRATYLWCKQPMVWEDFGSEIDCLQFEVESANIEDTEDSTEEEYYKTVSSGNSGNSGHIIVNNEIMALQTQVTELGGAQKTLEHDLNTAKAELRAQDRAIAARKKETENQIAELLRRKDG